MQYGSDTTVSGVKTVTFPTPFSATPKICCQVIDPSGRSISIVITEKSASQFKVKTTISGSAAHTHQIGTAHDSVPFNLAVASATNSHSFTGSYTSEEGLHGHFVQGTTNSAAATHGHGLTGTIDGESSHTHNFGGLTSGTWVSPAPSGYWHPLTLGGVSVGNTFASINLGSIPSLNTGGGSSHTHSYSLTVGQSSADHTHTMTNVVTDNQGSHSHNVDGTISGNGSHSHSLTLGGYPLALYMRGLTLGGVGVGSVFQSTEEEEETLYTASGGGSSTPSTVDVAFDWIARG